jgi:hypothetical protein
VEDLDGIARTYRLFAEREARGRSPLYERLALAVSNDRPTLEFLAALPRVKRQPNLLFAAVGYLYGTTVGWAEFRSLIERHADDVAGVMRVRRTQTNEPARCATLLPVLARLPQPLALLEVGAAAGLCLLPDHYAYDYDGRRVAPRIRTGAPAPVFSCRVNAATPVPAENVQVAWRAGVDIEPIDLGDDDQVAWLEALVWPGEGTRLELLRAAIEIARRRPPIVHRGDLLTDVRALLASAPADATLVVFHTAVLPYVGRDERAAFARLARRRFPVWIANEGPRLLPRAARLVRGGTPRSGEFLLSLDERPIAWTDPHGGHIEWLV